MEEKVGSICLACGLCCGGVLHTHALIYSADVERVRSLNLIVETFDWQFGFRLPCLLHLEQRCSVYPNRARICRDYRCKLLNKLRCGALNLEQAARLVRGAHALYADVLAQLPAGYSLDRLRQEIEHDYDWGAASSDRLKGARPTCHFFSSSGRSGSTWINILTSPREAKRVEVLKVTPISPDQGITNYGLPFVVFNIAAYGGKFEQKRDNGFL